MRTTTFRDFGEDEDPEEVEERKEERQNDKLAEIVLGCHIPFPDDLFQNVDPDGQYTLLLEGSS